MDRNEAIGPSHQPEAPTAEGGNDYRGGDNRLGIYLRQRRKALGMTLAQVASEVNFSLSLVSKAELGQLPEGPTLKLLERLANTLGVDVMKLVLLKEEDANAAHSTPAGTPAPNQPATEAERRMLFSFRALDERIQQNLLGQVQLLRSLQESGKGAGAVPADLMSDAPAAYPLPEHVARDCEALAGKYKLFGRFAEAVANYENARAIYERIGRLGSAARTWFLKGCIMNHLSRYSEGEEASQQQRPRLDSADACFGRADRLFQDAEANGPDFALNDDEKEYRPENLRHWAVNDMQTARALAKEGVTTPEYHVATLRHYKDKAAQKQERAAELFTEWIQDLEDRLRTTCEGGEEPGEGRHKDRLRELLAEAYHRTALLHSNMAAEQIRFRDVLRLYNLSDTESDVANSQEAKAQSALCRSSFRQAVQLRRGLTLAAASQQERDHHLSKLANDHQGLGYATQNYDYTLPKASPVLYERALYHLMLADKIDALLPQGAYPGQRKAIHLLIATLERDNGLSEDMQVAIRRRVETRVTQAELGTREQPELDYELDLADPGTTA